MIGIYNGVSSNVQFGDLLKNGSIAPFLQSSNIETGENTIYAYNLIDGTTKLNLVCKRTHLERI